MTWLAPLFLTAGLAIAAPILFHMWQRTPRGRRLFSSTMFLTVSPPRVTQRSRIENWFLLALRALALILIAIAFSRPVWRTEAPAPAIASHDRTVAILVDVSASLQRAGFWESLLMQVAERLQTLPDDTHLGLFAFDHRWKAVVPFRETDRLEAAAARRQFILERLSALKPGWGSTRLGHGLSQTMQALREYEASRQTSELQEIWLASDLASGADLTGLAGIDWPESTRFVTLTPQVAPGTNAGLQWVEARAENNETRPRVRVTNAKQSTRDRFQIGWDSATSPEERIDIHVPAGQSRTIQVPERPADLAESAPLRLTGDDHEFDNRLWAAKRQVKAIWIFYAGGDAADDPAGARFFLEQALSGTADVQIALRTVHEVTEEMVSVDPPAFAVWTDAGVEPPKWLRGVLEQGGSLLAVPQNAADARQMLAWQGLVAETSDAAVKDFSLLGEIDFEDPLFATFAQARFADFTGIHFWKHRRVQLPASFSGQVLARFDDGDSFLIRQPIGEGRCWTMTSGWQPADSQLARSSKFAPLLFRLLEQSTPLAAKSFHSSIGSEIRWPFLRKDGPVVVRQPDDGTIELADPATAFSQTDFPGIYVATCQGESAAWAINVAQEESKTDPLPIETLERFGALTIGSLMEDAVVKSPSQQRQLQLEELERRQSIWRWCLLAAGVVLLIETAWAGWKSRIRNLTPANSHLP